MSIHKAKQVDLRQIAICHQRAFPNSFASKLGLTYLIKMYEWYLSTGNTFLFFIEEHDQLIGYVGGLLKDGTVRTGSASGMTQFSFAEAVKALLIRPWLFFHPEIVIRYKFILKNIRMKFLGAPKQPERDHESKKQAGLVIIAVDPAYHGNGYGSLLLKQFEMVCGQRGFNNLQLSVKRENARAINAYRQNGWIISRENGNDYVMEKVTYVEPTSL